MLLRKLTAALLPLLLCVVFCAALRLLDGWLGAGGFWVFALKGVLLGGLLGTFLGKVLPETLKEHLPTMFGLCSIVIGVNSVIKASGMTAVVLAILLLVFGAGKLLAGVLTPTMFADLSACGGILTMAAGFRVSRIKSVPLVDLMPALILVMPFSLLWSNLM